MSYIVNFVSERKTIKQVRYTREFKYIGTDDKPDYAFPCDENGNVNINDKNYIYWKNNYEMCLRNTDYEDFGIEKIEYNYKEPALAECSCGRKLQLIHQYNGA